MTMQASSERREHSGAGDGEAGGGAMEILLAAGVWTQGLRATLDPALEPASAKLPGLARN